MPRTALEMTPDELKQYRPFSRERPVDQDRFDRAWEIARQAANLLYGTFGARQVVVFGSLTQLERFARWSDIDLAVWGIPKGKFFKAAAKVLGMAREFEIDFVDAEALWRRLRGQNHQ